MKAALSVIAALLTVLPPVARADLAGAVNWARLQGCKGAARREPLHDSPKLATAALRLSTGQSLHASLAAAGYLAMQSSAVHVSGVADDAEIGRLLSAHDCTALTDPRFSEFGVRRQGREIWFVLAAPVSVPTDEARVGRQILELINEARASGRRCGNRRYAPAPPLTVNASLVRAALAHSREMASDADFDHRGRDGSTPGTRVERAGYGSYSIVGENIAAGAMTPAEVAHGWLESPPHCENIMDPRFTETGSAFAVNLADAEIVYWTQDFAAPRRTAQGSSRR